MTSKLSQLAADSIEAASKAVIWLTEADRDDLRQDLLEYVLTRGEPEDVRKWAKNRAFSWAKSLVLAREARLRSEAECVADRTLPTDRRGPIWRPTWFPPHPDAQEFAPLACEGARVIHVKA